VERLRLENQGADGWRHFIGTEPIRCGRMIEAFLGDEWIRGRYEADDLSPASIAPAALDANILRLARTENQVSNNEAGLGGRAVFSSARFYYALPSLAIGGHVRIPKSFDPFGQL
jgi:hypothetical protein